MFNKIILTCMLALPFVLTADDHKMHDKAKKEMMEKKRMEMMMQRKQRMGFWKPEDCKKVSDASGLFLYFSGQAIDEASALEEEGKTTAADEKYLEGMALAELAANYAKNFEAYCK